MSITALLPDSPSPALTPRMHFPVDRSLQSTWFLPSFDDSGASWSDASTAIGYEISVAGFSVTNYKANITVDNLATAESAIANPSFQISDSSEIASSINYLDTDGTGHYIGDDPFPGSFIGEKVDDFVVEATATVTVPAAGWWTFGVNSDDGFSLDVGS